MVERTSMEIRLIADAYNIRSRGQAWLVSFTARCRRRIRRVNKVYSEQPFMLCRPTGFGQITLANLVRRLVPESGFVLVQDIDLNVVISAGCTAGSTY